MKKKDSKFLPIAEQYLKYKNKRDFNNMIKLENRYNISFKSPYGYEYMYIGDESFLFDYNYKTHKYFIAEILKIDGMRKSEVDIIKNKMEIFMNNKEYEI